MDVNMGKKEGPGAPNESKKGLAFERKLPPGYQNSNMNIDMGKREGPGATNESERPGV